MRLALFLLCEYYFHCYCVYYIVSTPYSAEDCATHNPDKQNYKYNGKEFDTTHGLNIDQAGKKMEDNEQRLRIKREAMARCKELGIDYNKIKYDY